MNRTLLRSSVLIAASTALAACGGGSSAGAEEGFGRRPDTLTGAYVGRIAVVETSCSGTSSGATIPINLEVIQSGDVVTAEETGNSYTGKVLTESYGFQVASQSLDGQFAEQRTFIYSGNGSKYNVTMVFTDKAKNCAGTYSGAVIYYS